MHQYLYSFRYEQTDHELCKLESRSIFDKELKNELLFSDIKIDPSNSAFIKRRLDIILVAKDYSKFIDDIKKERIRTEGFKLEYLVLDGDTRDYAARLEKVKDVGFSIETYPDYYNPSITYGICNYEGIWYFGVLIKNNAAWHKHKKKPHTFCNSLKINIAKSLVNIAAKAKKERRLLDACCGVGTILLEACFAGNNIEGCDINSKACQKARANLSYFNYKANVYCSDIKDISQGYDAVILDLPYNLLSSATNNDIIHIIESTAAITDRIVIVYNSDISNLISQIGFTISDSCCVRKRGRANFSRTIWVCDRNK